MTDDRAVQLALGLMRLGVSGAGVTDLLAHYPHDVIERQLAYLPYRKAKRPEAFIIDAIRHNYSPPKEVYYAPAETQPDRPTDPVDQDAQSPDRSGSADAA